MRSCGAARHHAFVPVRRPKADETSGPLDPATAHPAWLLSCPMLAGRSTAGVTICREGGWAMSRLTRGVALACLSVGFTLFAAAAAHGGKLGIASTGALGLVNWQDGYYTYYLNTDSGTVDASAPGGGSWNVLTGGRLVSQPGGPDVMVYDFTTVNIGPGVTLYVVGNSNRPAVIAATGSVIIAGNVRAVNGRPGAEPPSGAAAAPGGGGGGVGPGYYVTVMVGGFTGYEPLTGGGGGGGGSAGAGSPGCASNLIVDKDGIAHQQAGGAGGAAFLLQGMPLQVGAGGGAGADRAMWGGPQTYGRGPGGPGGGAVMITTPGDLTVAGTISAVGGAGVASNDGGGGGGGAGGSVWLQVGGALTVAAAGVVTVAGGAGGIGPGGSTTIACGGQGGGGLIEIDATSYTNQGTVTAGTGTVAVLSRTLTISGTLAKAWGGGIEGATVTLTGFLSRTATTDADGKYSFAQLAEGAQYQVAVSMPTYLVAPASRNVSNLLASQVLDFTGDRPSIGGTVQRLNGQPLSGTTLTLSGSMNASLTTGASGSFSFAHVPYGGTFTLTPSRDGFVFPGQTATFTALTADGLANITATALLSLSGRVHDLNDTGLAGVTIALGDGATATTTTDAEGRFRFDNLLEGGNYTLTPSLTDFKFSPGSLTVTSLAENQSSLDLTATLGVFRRYFAEGATSDFFDTRLAVLNATGAPATAKVTFQTGTGQVVDQSLTLRGLERATVDPKRLGLTHAEFSTVIESDQPLVADRTMTWDRTGYGGHAETSIQTPRTEWYLAEGATIAGFNLFYLVQNATTAKADIEVTYLRPSPRPPLVKRYDVPAQSRFNIWVNTEDPALAAAEISAVIRSRNGVPVIVERAMYLDSPDRTFNAGHESAAVAEPATEWFLAEGATGRFFDLFILVANPSTTDADIEASFLLPSGRVISRTYRVTAQSRFNIWANVDPDLADTAVSTRIRSTNGVPVIVERTMWWPRDVTWYEGHNSAGATQTGTKWALADGEVGPTEETYVLIANTSAFSGQARVTLTFEDGTQADQVFTLSPTSRLNVPVGLEFPIASGKRFGVVVESLGTTPAELVVERAMYASLPNSFWDAGTNVVGTRLR
jgi:hypothetical protein